MWEDEERRSSEPGIVHVDRRANGQIPAFYRRGRAGQTQSAPPQPTPRQPQRQQSIITMRHVREHLPVVVGELLDDDESNEILNQDTPREKTEATEATEELSDQSLNSSSESLNASNPMLNAKIFLRNKFQGIKKKKFSPLRRTKKLTNADVLLLSPDVMAPPFGTRCEDVGNINHMSDLHRSNGSRNFSLSSTSIPEDVTFEPSEEINLPLQPSSTEEELELEDEVLNHILTVCPDADRRATHRSLREGCSVRSILSGLCANSANSSEESPGELNDSDAIEQTEQMVRQVQEAFPNVNVDRSYALLRDKSLQTVMCQLAEESLSGCGSGDFCSSDSSFLSDSEMAVQMVQDAFPHIEKENARNMLRTTSVSSVMMQLAAGVVYADETTPITATAAAASSHEEGVHDDDGSSNQDDWRNQSHESLVEHIMEAFPAVSDVEAHTLLQEKRSVSAVMEVLANQTSEEFRITQNSSGDL